MNYSRSIKDITSNTSGQLSNETFYPLVKQSAYMVAIFSVAYSVIFFFAFFGNILVIIVVIRNKSMHTVTNYFIINLAVSDLLVALFCVPVTLIANLFNGWQLGWVLCKAIPYLQGASIGASVNTLAAIAIDRNLAICFILQFRVTRRACRIIIGIIWTCTLLGCLPWALYYSHMRYPSKIQEIYICYPKWPSVGVEKSYFLFVFLVFYVIPLIVVCVCYGMIGVRLCLRKAPRIASSPETIHKSKVRALKMLLTVCICFALSWLPLYSLYIWHNFKRQPGMSYPTLENIIKPIAQWLGQANSGFNPIIYCFFSKKFRKGFISAISCFSRNRFARNDFMERSNTTKYMSVQFNNGAFRTSLQNLSYRNGGDGFDSSGIELNLLQKTDF